MTLTLEDTREIREIVHEELKIQNIPDKDELYSMIDELIGEVKAMREEHAVYSHRISRLEDIHPNFSHSSA